MNMESFIDYQKYFSLIKTKNYKRVCLQFPDGLKHKSKDIIKRFEESNPNTIFYAYLGSCFGACDYPIELKDFKFDAIIQFGHNDFVKNGPTEG